MKKIFCWVALLMLFSSWAHATDYTAGATALNGNSYNKAYRDVKDGTNAETFDMVSANSIALTSGFLNTIKSSGGYLDNITFPTACFSSTITYIVADATATAGAYATVISSVQVFSSPAAPFNIPYHGRFVNGLVVNVYSSTCPVTVSYR